MRIIIIMLFLVACKQENKVTYQQGIDRCTELLAIRQKQNPKVFQVSYPSCMIGSTIPELNCKSISGKVITPEYFDGKISLINFWFEGCPPCVAEIPILNEIMDKYGTTNFNYVAIGNDSEVDISEFLKTHPWKFEQIPNGKEIYQNVFKTMWGYPTTFIIDKNRTIVGGFAGLYEGNKMEIMDLLAKLNN
ncbi:MAG: TlpA disulfide reductase family protein [Saprospiraceae bacterium]